MKVPKPLRWAFALTLTAVFHPKAKAELVSCTLVLDICNPSTGGIPHGVPYIWVAGPNGDFIDISHPGQITYTYADSVQTDTAYGSLATGLLQTTGHALAFSGYNAISINAADLFTLSGPPGMVSITARFRVSGKADLAAIPAHSYPSLIAGGDANISLCGPGGSFACGGDSFSYTDSAPPFGGSFAGYSGPIFSDSNHSQLFLERDYTFTQQVGQQFYMSYGMSLQAYDLSSIDLTDPGKLDFILPSGYSISSVGGFAPVPEPSSISLLVCGLGAMLALRAKARR